MSFIRDLISYFRSKKIRESLDEKNFIHLELEKNKNNDLNAKLESDISEIINEIMFKNLNLIQKEQYIDNKINIDEEFLNMSKNIKIMIPISNIDNYNYNYNYNKKTKINILRKANLLD